MINKNGSLTVTPTVGEDSGTYVVTVTASQSSATATIEVAGGSWTLVCLLCGRKNRYEINLFYRIFPCRHYNSITTKIRIQGITIDQYWEYQVMTYFRNRESMSARTKVKSLYSHKPSRFLGFHNEHSRNLLQLPERILCSHHEQSICPKMCQLFQAKQDKDDHWWQSPWRRRCGCKAWHRIVLITFSMLSAGFQHRIRTISDFHYDSWSNTDIILLCKHYFTTKHVVHIVFYFYYIYTYIHIYR